MGFTSPSILILFSLVTLLLPQFSQSMLTVVIDGVAEWKNPQLQVGDAAIFQHKHNYTWYIFKNQNAFTLCNFTQATILTKPHSSSYTWHVSRPGLFYFSFKNGSNRACLDGHKYAVNVTPLPPPPPPPESPPTLAAPPQNTGGTVASSPAFPWPFQPRENASPSPAPGLADIVSGPVSPDREGMPFINSNPAVPLPTGEIDSATIRPLSISGGQNSKQVMGLSVIGGVLSFVILLLMMMK